MTMTLRRRATAVVSLAVVLAIAAFIHGRASGSPACTVTWTGASADQLWQTPGNWSPVHVPGPTDYACVPSASIDSITFTGFASVAGVSALGSKLVVNGALSLTDVAQASTIRNLRLTGNALSVAAGDTLTLAGHPVFAGGSIGGGGVVTMPAGANLAVIGASAVRNGTTLNLNGATAWSAGSFCLGEGSMINNAAAFTAAVNGAALADCAGPAINRFHNLAGGNLIRTGTAVPPLVFSTLFDNDGIVTTGPGALQIGANSAGASDTGSYVLGSGSALVLAGPRSFAAGATITGAGLTQVVQDVTFAGQSVDHLLVQSGTVRGAFALPGDATWTGGVIDGPATATVSPTGTLAINGPLSLRNGRTLNNSGAVSWSAGAVCLGEASTLNNSGTLTLGADSVVLADCSGAAGNRIHNLGAGTMLRIGTAGLDATITAPFDNDGTVHVGSGNLSLGAKTTGATDTGTYSTDAGSKLSLLPATPGRTFAASVTFGGAGLLSVNQSVAFAGQTLPHLALVGGTVKGPFVATGDFLWSTARLDGASTTTIANTATVTITKTVSIRTGKTVQNSGSIAWSGGSICVSGGSHLDNAGSITASANGQSIYDCAVSTPSRVHNLAGATITRTGAPGQSVTVSVPFDNDGTVNVGPGDLILGSNSAGASDTGAASIASGSALVLSGGASRTMTAAAVVSGAGLLEVNENMTFAGQSLAHLAIQGGTVTGPFTPTGDLTLSGGTLDGASTTTIAASSIVNINSGISLRHGKKLINNGTVRWSAGTICLGEAAGVTNNTANFTLTGDGSSMVDCAGGAATSFTNNQSGWVTVAVPTGIAINVPFTNNGKLKIDLGNVTVTGNYAPAVNSTLQVKVAGNEPGYQFGHLHVSGTMTIAGNLMLTADPGFSPDLNDTFAIADAGGASSGSFQSTSQSPLSTPNGMGYGVTYPAKTVLLTASLAADLSVSVSAPSSATVGTNITYTDFVLNSGPNPTSVTLTHTIPSGLTFVSASAGCTSTTTLVTCTVGTMNANTSKNVLVVLHSTFVDGYDVTAKVVGAGTLDVTPSGAVSTKHVNVT